MDTSNLLEPQKSHSKNLLDSLYLNGWAFDGSPTGTGKTYCAGSISKNIKAPIVVICPKVSRKIWKDTLAIFGIKALVIVNYEKLIRGNTPYYTFNLKEYVNAKHWWESSGININFPKNALVICDEVHKAKGAKSKAGKLLVALKNNGYKLLLLSATAACNVTEMRNFGYAVHLHTGGDFRSFAREHGAENSETGMLIVSKDDAKAKDGIVRIHDTLFTTQKCASKMNIKDFGDIFPENRIIAESFDLGATGSAKLQAVYDRMEQELADLEARSENYSEHIFAVIMKARRHAEILKVPVTAEWIEDRMDEGVSPVVFFNFCDSLQAVESRIATKFKGLIAKVVGGQTDDERNRGLDEFQGNKRKIVLANMSAGSASLNMHDTDGNFPRNSLICPSWSAIMTIQAIGRIFRAKGKSQCIQKFLFAAEIEERQRARVQSKIKNISQLVDGALTDADLAISDTYIKLY
jgi:hypothetical protein